MIAGHKFEAVWAKSRKTQIWECREQKLRGVVIENDLSFDKFVVALCQKAWKKLNALARQSSFVSLTQRKVLITSLFKSKFW